ncbi:MAG: type II secretion system protein [Undibacterium sp.]|uniref:type II secretion system protein n=1 Tax=Undibacterium sp. TaxID=1914977 RepID=UPI002724B246|nr:type II secretion system protein [Undibacterium sp.]MDO8653449.1 type II secretion system protein [Undibacterium sp.]
MKRNDPHLRRTMRCQRTSQNGFSYIALLIAIAIIGLVAASGLQVGAILSRRNAELELLAIGKEYRNALLSYAIASSAGQRQRPNSLAELLKDPRFPNPKRHLRKIYPDPLTGEESWGIIMSPDGSGIVGIFSKLDRKPIKIGNFDLEFAQFSGKTSYRDWVFALAQ